MVLRSRIIATGRLTFSQIILISYCNLCFGSGELLHRKMHTKAGSDIILKCPYILPDCETKWLGPPHFTTYAYKTSVKKSLSHFERLGVVGNHSIGEFNLEIRNFSLKDTGFYRCMTTSGTSLVTVTFHLEIYEPPSNMRVNSQYGVDVIIVTENKSVSLNCSVESGNPLEDMMWILRSETIAFGGPGHLSYSFRPSRNDHKANFTCLANNSDIEIPLHHSIQLLVELIPDVKIVKESPIVNLLEGRSLKLQCQYDTNVHPITFKWLRNNIVIGNGTKVSQKSILLTLHNISREDSGTYRCYVSNRIGTGMDDTNVVVMYKPHTLRATYTFNAQLMKPAKVLLQIQSFEKPIGMWIYSSGGALGIWGVSRMNNSSTFILSSEIVPRQAEHFGIYGVRVRNSAGSTDIKVKVYQSDIPVRMSTAHTECNVSSSVLLKCIINTTFTDQWTCVWKHYIDDVFVRSIEGIKHSNMSTMQIPLCNYQDQGEYKCVVKINDTEFSSSAMLTVNGPPFVLNTSILFNRWLSIISVYFYSMSVSHDTAWFLKMNNTFNSEHKINVESNSFNQSTSNIAIQMTKYGVQVNIPVHLLVLTTSINFSREDILICQLQNVFGTTETTFNIYSAKEKNLGTVTTVYDHVLTPKGTFPVYSLYIYICCVVLVLLVFIVGSLMVQRKLKRITTVEITAPTSINSGDSKTSPLASSLRMTPSTHSIVSLNYELHRISVDSSFRLRQQNIESESDSSLYEYPMASPVIEHFNYDYVDNTKLDVHFYDICKENRTHNEKGNVIPRNSDDTVSSYTVAHNAYLVVLGSTNSVNIRNDTLAANFDKRKSSLETFKKRNQSIKDSGNTRKRLHSI